MPSSDAVTLCNLDGISCALALRGKLLNWAISAVNFFRCYGAAELMLLDAVWSSILASQKTHVRSFVFTKTWYEKGVGQRCVFQHQ